MDVHCIAFSSELKHCLKNRAVSATPDAIISKRLVEYEVIKLPICILFNCANSDVYDRGHDTSFVCLNRVKIRLLKVYL